MSNAYNHPTGRTRTRKAAPDPWGADPLGMLIAGESRTPLTLFQLEAIARGVKLWREHVDQVRGLALSWNTPDEGPGAPLLPGAAAYDQTLIECQTTADALLAFLEDALPGLGAYTPDGRP